MRPRADAVFDAFLSGRTDSIHPDDHAKARAFWDMLGTLERPAETTLPTPCRWPRWAIAAAVTFALLGGAAWQLQPAPDAFSHSYAAGHAERRAIRLDDGSVVTLAADSRVDIAYTAGERRLRLTNGEALFEVAHNTARPFIVETRHGDVKAVGTAFDVAVKRHDAEVTVVEGVIRIALSTGGGDAVQEPIVKLARKGERLAFGVDTGKTGNVGFIRQQNDVDLVSATAWTRGQLVFHGEPLEQVIARINLYSRDRVVLVDRHAAQLPVYGVVNQGDTSAIREIIANPQAVAIRSGGTGS